MRINHFDNLIDVVIDLIVYQTVDQLNVIDLIIYQ